MTVLQHVKEVKTAMPRRIVDGDTWWCYVDLDYRQLGYFEHRLDGWDTPEKQGPETSPWERQMAREATFAVEDWWKIHIAATDRRVFVRTEPDPEKFGRWLAGLWAETPAGLEFHLGQFLEDRGLAVPSNGTKGTRWRDTYRG